MGKHVAGRGAQERCGGFGIDGCRDGACGGGAVAQGGDDLGLTAQTVADEPIETGGGCVDRPAVAGMEDAPFAGGEPRTGGHEVGQITIGGRDQRGRPAHHMVGGETGIAPDEAKVVADVTGGVDRFKLPAFARDPLAIGKDLVRGETRINAFAAPDFTAFGKRLHHRRASGGGIAEGQHRGAGCVGQGTRQGRVVRMGMGDDDMGDALLRSDGVQDRLQMRGAVGAGVDHGKAAGAQKIGVGAPIGHGRGVGCHDTAQAWFERFGHADGGIEVIGRQHVWTFHRERGLAKVYCMSFLWLKHYMPRGIYGRATLILLLPVVFVQLVVTVLFAQRHFEGVTQQMTDAVLMEVSLVLDVVEEAPSRAAVPAAVAARLGALEYGVIPVTQAQVPVTSRMVWYDYSGRVARQRFADRLEEFRALDLTSDIGVRLFIETQKGPFELRFERARMSAKNPHQLFVYTIFFGVVMTLIASIYLRNQLRPIKRLARVAEAFGRGRHEPYAPAGAIEVRSAGNAFIDMRNRIERQIEQRTLMLSGVSHDLRTPLTRMRLGLSMLEDEDAEALRQDVDDMQRMLDEFLEFAKGAAEGTPEAVDPHGLAAEIVAQAQRAGRDVTLLPAVGEGKGTVLLRLTAIRRAVDNLISNAVRYGARAEVEVMLTDKTLRIRVEDDGPGIPEDRRIDAARPFVRLDPARNQDKGSGVGLGLAIATDVARAHGGVLRLGESTRLGGLRADIVIGR